MSDATDRFDRSGDARLPGATASQQARHRDENEPAADGAA
jgi:hypothetical protein